MTNLERYVLGYKMDLNRADAFELSLLPGLGRVRAERIINEANKNGGFDSWEKLHASPDVPDEIFSALKHWFFIAENPCRNGGANAGP
jgi:DNA uptake protein ComE-like DNA-binding protein